MDRFCIFILTHGRPDRVYTYNTLRKGGYTGAIYVVIDDEDKTGDDYRQRYGAEVLTFSKREVAATFDEGQNAGDRRAIVYARNACWKLAAQVGIDTFVQLDDDYTGFWNRFDATGAYVVRRIASLDALFSVLYDFYRASGALALAISQGGDHIGGARESIRLHRKAMNSVMLSTDRPFRFLGRVNEDVNTYTSIGRSGGLFFTVLQIQLNQPSTQSNAGGMTDLYLDSGTYVKTAFSVMYCPSAVKIASLSDPRSPHHRIHHRIRWDNVAPKIIGEQHRKGTT